MNEMNNNVQPVGQKKNGLPIVVLILLVVVCFALGYFIGQALGNMSNDKEDSNVITSNSNVESNSNENSNDSMKVDDSKDYVYDADYKLTSTCKYLLGYDKSSLFAEFEYKKSDKRYFEDLKVPYINLKSEDAEKANAEIEKIYKDVVDTYNKCAIPGENPGIYMTLDYKKYSYGDYISVIIGFETFSTSGAVPDYYTYTFNTKTGKLVTYTELLTNLGYDIATVRKTAINKANAISKTKKDNSSCKGFVEEDKKASTYSEGNKAYYDTNVKNNTVLFTITNEGTVKVVVKDYHCGYELVYTYNFIELTK